MVPDAISRRVTVRCSTMCLNLNITLTLIVHLADFSLSVKNTRLIAGQEKFVGE